MQRRRSAQHLLDTYRISVCRACRVVGLQRARFAYKIRGRDDVTLHQRLRELAQVRVRYGSQHLYILLRREGWLANHKRVHRIYCLKVLNSRSKYPRRNRAAAHRLERLPLGRLHRRWRLRSLLRQWRPLLRPSFRMPDAPLSTGSVIGSRS